MRIPRQLTLKHKTPNYRQVRQVWEGWNKSRNAYESAEWWTWEAMPLRADRKDLKGAE